MKRRAALVLAALLASCGKGEQFPESAGYGPDPKIPAPDYAWVAPIRIAEPIGWKTGEAPRAAPGLQVSAFAAGLKHPRWLLPLANGDLLVAESDGKPEPVKRPKDVGFIVVMSKAKGATKAPNRISLLRDADGDGRAERSDFITGLDAPFGMALVGDALYVADTGALLRFRFAPGADRPSGPGEVVARLPGGPINHHWTKNVIASRDGAKLYVTVGSNSNVGENGMEHEVDRAAILEIDPATGTSQVFAGGLRNPNGMDWEPVSGALWTVVNERDEIGDNASPDYLTSVRPGGFYGWPWAYWGQHVDRRPYPARPDMVAKSLKPDYGLSSHTGSLGLAFAKGAALGPAFSSGAFIGQHGSWNRSRPSGYKVLYVPFAGGKPAGMPVTVLDGFLAGKQVRGRPVGVAFASDGSLLVADDAGNTVWRVTAAPAAPAPP